MQQQAATAAAQSAAQAQGAQQPVNVPPAPAGPQGTNVPFSVQKDAVGGPGNATPPPGAAPPTPPSPGGDGEQPENQEQGPPS